MVNFLNQQTKSYTSGCVQKLKTVLEKGMHEGEAASKLLEAEHGILDIVEAGARLWLQSGHSEKAVALYQALIEFNLFRSESKLRKLISCFMFANISALISTARVTTLWMTDSACLSRSGTAA